MGTDTTRARPLLAHWNGRLWKAVPVPIRWGGVDGLVARNPREAWATVRNRSGTALLRWGGARWTRERLPAYAGTGAGIAAGPRGTAWLVGTRVMQRKGGKWAETVLEPLTRGSRIVASLHSDELWRIRERQPATGRPAVVDRWTGSTWTRTPLATSLDTELSSLVALSRNLAWLAGTAGDRGLLFRWNGETWRRATGPPPNAVEAHVSATGRGKVWLSGSLSNRAGTVFPPYLRQQEGQRWLSIKPPTSESSASFRLHPVGNAVWATTLFESDVLRLDCTAG